MKVLFPRRFNPWLVAIVSLATVAFVAFFPAPRSRAANPTSYDIVDLGAFTPGTESKAFGINSCGQVAGYATTNGTSDKRPFFRPSNSLINLGVLSGDGIAKSVNNSGYVVGHSPTDGVSDRAFIWHDDNGDGDSDAGEMKQLLPNGAVGSAEDVNDNGKVAGWIFADGGSGGTGGFAGFVWENNNFQLITGSPAHNSTKVYGINNAGTLVGEDSDTIRAFVLRSGVFTDISPFPGGNKSVAYAVSEADHVVGAATINASTMHAFIWTDAGLNPSLKDLGTLTGKTRSEAYNIAIVNGSEVRVVGTSYSPDLSDARAFVWQDANGDGDGNGVEDAGEMKDLTTLISDSSWTVLQQARAINSSGQIVGFGLKSNGETHAFLLTPTGVSPSPCLPTVNVTVSPAAVNEDAASSLTYTFTRSIVTGSPLTVNFSIGGTAVANDYAISPVSTVQIPANQMSATVTVTPMADLVDEPNETVILTVTPDASYSVGTAATGTITDDDPTPTIQITNVTAAEPNPGPSNFVFTVSLTNPSSTQITVNYATDTTGATATGGASCGGTVDFVNILSTGLTFAAGETSKQVNVQVCSDSDVEPDDTFFVTLSGNSSNSNLPANTKGTGTISNDDSLPGVSVAVSPLTTPEDGATNLVYTFSRTGVTTGPLTVNFSVSGTATLNSDYSQSGAATFSASAGTVTLLAGSSSATVTVDPTADNTVEPDETVVLAITANAAYTVGSPSSATGTITNDDIAMTVQLAQSTFTVIEDAPVATITVTRSGDTSSSATVRYSTSDMAGLQSCTVTNTMASERCDYTTSVGRVTFAPAESSKTFTVPIVNDVWVEGNETFFVNLSSPTGASLGSQATSTVEINDNDFATPTSNPIFGVEYFIRALYRDILNRQPDSQGLQNWIDTLTPCPNGGFGEPATSNCDRLHISAGFFQSDEYLNRGYWAFRFYMVSFNQRPTYAQFIPDLSEVGGPKSPAEEEAAKIAYADAFVQRPAFLAEYSGLSGQALANALTQKTGLPQFTITPGMTNGQILRAIAERQTSLDKFLTEGTVSILYFGFQRRDPDAVGYQNNVDTLNANPNNLRHMIFIFIYSTEYLNRFGPQ